MEDRPTRFPSATPDLAELAAAVPRLREGSVTVIGDVMLDRYLYGTVRRISPEAPVPVLTVEREAVVPGGAGNVVRNLTALGTASAFVSVLGDDQAGAELTGLIGGQPGVVPWLLVEGGRTTTLKVRYLAAGQQLLRADHEEVTPLGGKLAERLVRIATDTMAATTITVISDYAKGVISKETAAALIAAARRLGRPVVVDPKSSDFARYAGADIITPNRRELQLASGMSVLTEDALIEAATSVRAAHGFGAVLVTQAEDGMTLVDAAGAQHFPAEAREVFDVSGAGDTVVATLAAGLAAGLRLPVATRLANIAAGIVVGKVGTAVARPEELLAALSARGGALRKIVTREAAAEQAER
ncbi:MAG: D-glycero-beta-D-manno-heptose-7-phosphate kinase, partial [Acetobacteraceae bacterium]